MNTKERCGKCDLSCPGDDKCIYDNYDNFKAPYTCEKCGSDFIICNENAFLWGKIIAVLAAENVGNLSIVILVVMANMRAANVDQAPSFVVENASKQSQMITAVTVAQSVCKAKPVLKLATTVTSATGTTGTKCAFSRSQCLGREAIIAEDAAINASGVSQLFTVFYERRKTRWNCGVYCDLFTRHGVCKLQRFGV